MTYEEFLRIAEVRELEEVLETITELTEEADMEFNEEMNRNRDICSDYSEDYYA